MKFIIAAIIVFLVGGALYLYTRAHAEDFAKALAGEATPTRFYAGTDL